MVSSTRSLGLGASRRQSDRSESTWTPGTDGSIPCALSAVLPVSGPEKTTFASVPCPFWVRSSHVCLCFCFKRDCAELWDITQRTKTAAAPSWGPPCVSGSVHQRPRRPPPLPARVSQSLSNAFSLRQRSDRSGSLPCRPSAGEPIAPCRLFALLTAAVATAPGRCPQSLPYRHRSRVLLGGVWLRRILPSGVIDSCTDHSRWSLGSDCTTPTSSPFMTRSTRHRHNHHTHHRLVYSPYNLSSHCRRYSLHHINLR
jgi:hypothetical protein